MCLSVDDVREQIENRLVAAGLRKILKHWEVNPIKRDDGTLVVVLDWMHVYRKDRRDGHAHCILYVFTGFCDEHRFDAELTAHPIRDAEDDNPEDNEPEEAKTERLIRLYSKHDFVLTGSGNDMFREHRPLQT